MLRKVETIQICPQASHTQRVSSLCPPSCRVFEGIAIALVMTKGKGQNGFLNFDKYYLISPLHIMLMYIIV